MGSDKPEEWVAAVVVVLAWAFLQVAERLWNTEVSRSQTMRTHQVPEELTQGCQDLGDVGLFRHCCPLVNAGRLRWRGLLCLN